MGVMIKDITYAQIEIANSDALPNSQIKTVKDRYTAGYYVGDNELDKLSVVEFFDNDPSSSEKKFIIDGALVNKYIEQVKEFVTPFSSLFKGKLNFQLNCGSFPRIAEIDNLKFTGESNRYLSFDNSDEDDFGYILRELLLGGISLLYILKQEDIYIIYPELKRDFSKEFALKYNCRELLKENIQNIKREYEVKYNDEWINYFIEENIAMLTYLKVKHKNDLMIILDLMGIESKIEVIDSFYEPDLINVPNLKIFNDTLNDSTQEDDSKSENNSNTVDFTKDLFFEGLYFEDEEKLKKEISNVLRSGKNIIFTGPPGTGKSKIAKQVANSLGIESKMVTATSEWSSYDLIGGYKPNPDGSLYFENGIILSSFKNDDNENINEWVIIDEINRADIDKAFGPLLSVLSHDDVKLGLKINGEDIEIKHGESSINHSKENEFYMHNDWRMIGTMNTFDKSSLFDISYAFSRRFAFIGINIPEIIDPTVINKYLELWGISLDPLHVNNLSDLWNAVNKVRPIGPALIRDMAVFFSLKGDILSALSLYIFPQLEGLYIEDYFEFFKIIEKLNIIDISSLKNSIESYFNITLSED